MKINHMEVGSNEKGSVVKLWCECRTLDEVEQIIEWMKLAKMMIGAWDRIRFDYESRARAVDEAGSETAS